MIKKNLITALVLLASFNGFTQEVEKKSIKKEVNLENENGVKTLTIKTEENGVTKTEVYRGEEADVKLAEIEKMTGGESEMNETKEVKLTEVNGKKHLTIVTTKGSSVDEEVYVGEEADEKLKEMGLDTESNEDQKKTKVIKKRKQKVLEKVNE